MSAPATPTGFYVNQGNRQVYVACDLTATATGYKVQRSADGVTYSVIASPSVPYYLDIAVTIGTNYYYKMAASNNSGVDISAYTSALSIVPAADGEMSLAQIRLNAQQRADQVNGQFLTTSEWNANINNSLFELYDLLVTAYGEEYFVATPITFNTDGSTQIYPLPDGNTTFTNAYTGASIVAKPFYKLLGVDLGPNMGPNGWVTIKKFNFIDRNMFFYPNTNSTLYGVFNMSYRLIGTGIEFIPLPSSGQPVRLWYIPRMDMLLSDTDCTTSGVSGWVEYVIVDAAIKAMQKEESDCSLLMSQKEMLKKRIEATAMNRDVGQPDTISDTRSNTQMSGPFGLTGGFKGGW